MPIADTLRFLMYHETYNKPETARQLFRSVSEELKAIDQLNLDQAMRMCPQQIDIATRLQKASYLLS